ncbi:MAG: DUF4080 domain-containing protein [Clostridiales bacterium]|nr:DUF4080 domain-containing protein [Clostridiales bacterium]
MKVVIGCLNAKYVHMSSAPWCLAAGIDEYSVSPVSYSIFEGTINSDIDSYAEEIISLSPDAVSFSCYIWNITKTLLLCEKIKAALSCTIILGGPEVAHRREDILSKYEFIDFVLSGEGEFTYPLLIDALCENGDIRAVPSLSYRHSNSICSTEDKIFDEIPPSPYNEAYLKALQGRICYLETSRGCPFSCAFCLSGGMGKLKLFPMERVKRDILTLANSSTQTVKLVDRTFNAVESHANEILTFIKDNYGNTIPHGVCFHMEIAADILKESTLNILSQMPKGAVQLEIGIQSFNKETLKAIHRSTNIQRLTENIKRLISFGNMHIHTDLIVGLPFEDMQSFEKSFDTAYSLGANMLQMGFLKLLYGAQMRESSDDYPCTFTNEPPYEVTSTPWLSEEEVISLKKCEDALERLYNSSRFLITLDYLINETGFTPFRLFFEFGNSVCGDKMSLSRYAVEVYNYFGEICDKELLREKILCDLLASSASSQIPKEIRRDDPRHKKAMVYFTKGGEGIKVAILNKSNRIFVAYQGSKRDFSGRYETAYFPMDVLEEK